MANSEVYFVKSGRFKALKKVDFKLSGGIDDPAAEDYRLGMFESKLLDIDELGQGDCFGDYDVFHEQKMSYSVITTLPSEAYVVSLFEFKKIDEAIYNELKRFAKPYSNDKELRRGFLERK